MRNKSLKGAHCQFLSEVKVGVALVPEKRHRMQDAVGAQHARTHDTGSKLMRSATNVRWSRRAIQLLGFRK
jgi:hypothetical protein